MSMIPPQVEAQIFGILVVTIIIFAILWYFCDKCPLAVDSFDEFGHCIVKGVKKIVEWMFYIMTYVFRYFLKLMGIKL